MTLLSIQSPSACPEAHEVAARTQHIKINVPHIIRYSRRSGWKTLRCLVSVQTNQYQRAVDLARAFRAAGLDVLIGGLHVSGVLTLFQHPIPDIQESLDLGVTVVPGEVEAEWEWVLWEALLGKRKPLYNFLEATPDLSSPPVPMPHQKYLQRYEPRFATGSPV
jgi:hypothetical protein